MTDTDSGTGPTTERHLSLERIQRECVAMMKLLTKLEQEELDLKAQNEILARYVLNCGFSPSLLEPPPPKRRRTTATAASSTTTTKKKTTKKAPSSA